MLYKKLKNYFVNDLLHVENNVIFVLESPHIQEVKNGYPVAGKSGNDMSKVLFGLDEAFGKLISGRTGYMPVIEKRQEQLICSKCNKMLNGDEKFCPECVQK